LLLSNAILRLNNERHEKWGDFAFEWRETNNFLNERGTLPCWTQLFKVQEQELGRFCISMTRNKLFSQWTKHFAVLNPTLLGAGTRIKAILHFYDEKQTVFSMNEALCHVKHNYFRCRNENSGNFAFLWRETNNFFNERSTLSCWTQLF